MKWTIVRIARSPECVWGYTHSPGMIHRDLLNSRFGYLSISRASQEVTLFTDNITKLAPQLSAEISKTSALEIGHAPAIQQSIGMGL